MNRFLETVTCLGNNVLVPINKIKYITERCNDQGSYEICIKGEDDFEWVEHFGENVTNASIRYEMIKEIINAR